MLDLNLAGDPNLLRSSSAFCVLSDTAFEGLRFGSTPGQREIYFEVDI